MQQKEIIINNKKLFYRITGEGPVVILLHGFGEDGTVWSNQFDVFNGYTLLIPDLPGSGKSEMINDMSIEGMAEQLAFFIKDGERIANTQPLLNQNANNLSISSKSEVSEWVSSSVGGNQRLGTESGMGVFLIGHSMGGYITLAFAEKYPELLNGLGLFHSTAYPDSEEKKNTRKKGIQFIQQHGSFEFLKTSIPNLYSAVTKEKNPSIIEEQIAASHNFSDAALVWYYRSMMERPDRTNVLKQTPLPVLFILGKYDNAVPLQDGLKLCRMTDLSYIHILEKSGHMGMKEEPNETKNILSDYLKSIHHRTQ